MRLVLRPYTELISNGDYRQAGWNMIIQSFAKSHSSGFTGVTEYASWGFRYCVHRRRVKSACRRNPFLKAKLDMVTDVQHHHVSWAPHSVFSQSLVADDAVQNMACAVNGATHSYVWLWCNFCCRSSVDLFRVILSPTHLLSCRPLLIRPPNSHGSNTIYIALA